MIPVCAVERRAVPGLLPRLHRGLERGREREREGRARGCPSSTHSSHVTGRRGSWDVRSTELGCSRHPDPGIDPGRSPGRLHTCERFVSGPRRRTDHSVRTPDQRCVCRRGLTVRAPKPDNGYLHRHKTGTQTQTQEQDRVYRAVCISGQVHARTSALATAQSPAI